MKEAPHTRERVPMGAWWMLGVLWLFYVNSFIDRFALSMLVESIKHDLGFTDTQISLLLGPAFTLFYAIFGIPLGWAADRLPRRWVIYFGSLLWSICAAGTGLARSFGLMFAARAGVAVGESSLTPSAFSLLGDRIPPDRISFALSIIHTGQYVGKAASFALVALILAHVPQIVSVLPFLAGLAPWQIALILIGAPGVILGLLVFTFSEPQRRDFRQGSKDKEPISNLVPFLKSEWRLIGLLMVGFGFVSMSAMAIGAWVPAYLQRHYSMGPLEYAPYLSIISLLGAVTLLLKGGILDWVYRRGKKDAHIRVYTWFILISSPAIYLIFVIDNVNIFLFLYAVVMIVTIPFMVFLSPAIQVFTPPAVRARMIAIFLFAIHISGALGPVSVGIMTDYVFNDPESLGKSLGIILGSAMTAAFIIFRLSMPMMRKAM